MTRVSDPLLYEILPERLMNCWVEPGVTPISSSWTVVPLSVDGSIGSLKVTLIVSGVVPLPALPPTV